MLTLATQKVHGMEIVGQQLTDLFRMVLRMPTKARKMYGLLKVFINQQILMIVISLLNCWNLLVYMAVLKVMKKFWTRETGKNIKPF